MAVSNKRVVQSFVLHDPIDELVRYGCGAKFNDCVKGWAADIDESTGVLTLRFRINGKLVWGPERFPSTSYKRYRLTSATAKPGEDE